MTGSAEYQSIRKKEKPCHFFAYRETRIFTKHQQRRDPRIPSCGLPVATLVARACSRFLSCSQVPAALGKAQNSSWRRGAQRHARGAVQRSPLLRRTGFHHPGAHRPIHEIRLCASTIRRVTVRNDSAVVGLGVVWVRARPGHNDSISSLSLLPPSIGLRHLCRRHRHLDQPAGFDESHSQGHQRGVVATLQLKPSHSRAGPRP